MKEINFTPHLFRKLKTAYRNAIRQGQDVFIFEGNEILTQYAKYLIEYLQTKFKNVK
jgi:hypothetical protein